MNELVSICCNDGLIQLYLKDDLNSTTHVCKLVTIFKNYLGISLHTFLYQLCKRNWTFSRRLYGIPIASENKKMHVCLKESQIMFSTFLRSMMQNNVVCWKRYLIFTFITVLFDRWQISTVMGCCNISMVWDLQYPDNTSV